MYENLGIQSVLSETQFEAYRVIGANASGEWAYTDSTGNVKPLAITTAKADTKTADGQWVTSAILLGGAGAVQVELDASADVDLGTYLVATDDGKVLDYTAAALVLSSDVIISNLIGVSLVSQDTDADETAIITATTNIPFVAIGELFVEAS